MNANGKHAAHTFLISTFDEDD